MDLLFQNATLVTQDSTCPLLHNAYLGITTHRIEWLSTQPPPVKALRTFDARNWVILPGFVNAHTHLPMTLLRGYADDMALQPWLFDKIFPIEAKLRPSDIEVGTQLAIVEAVAGGVVSFTDMYSELDTIAQCVVSAGVKANLSCGVIHLNKPWVRDESSGLAELFVALKQWHGYDNGRVRIDASIHAEYTSSPAVWRDIADIAREHKLNMHVHVSETQTEHDDCLQRTKLTPTQALAAQGVFDVPTTIGHGVWLTDDDMALLAQKQTTVAHCPASNLKLASGFARVEAMRRNGLNVALGSDGMASHNAMDMFADMKLASLVQKAATADPTALPACEALQMATYNGAVAQGREAQSGKLALGYDADLCVVDFDRPHLTPRFDVQSHLVYAAKASDVVMTLVRGQIVYDHGNWPTIDTEKVQHRLQHEVLPHLFG